MHYKFLAQVLLKMRIPFIHMTTKEFLNGHKISSIILMNVVGELVKPKYMIDHSKRPSLDLKVVFHTLVCLIGT
jgi:hypothetical protein